MISERPDCQICPGPPQRCTEGTALDFCHYQKLGRTHFKWKMFPPPRSILMPSSLVKGLPPVTQDCLSGPAYVKEGGLRKVIKLLAIEEIFCSRWSHTLTPWRPTSPDTTSRVVSEWSYWRTWKTDSPPLQKDSFRLAGFFKFEKCAFYRWCWRPSSWQSTAKWWRVTMSWRRVTWSCTRCTNMSMLCLIWTWKLFMTQRIC